MIPSVEARAQRKVTEAFIAADSEVIILTEQVRQSNGSGGFKMSAGPKRQPVVGRVVPVARGGLPQERLTADGRSVPVEFFLVLPYDAEIGVYDRFTSRGRQFEVVHVQEKRDYQTKAELVTRG